MSKNNSSQISPQSKTLRTHFGPSKGLHHIPSHQEPQVSPTCSCLSRWRVNPTQRKTRLIKALSVVNVNSASFNNGCCITFIYWFFPCFSCKLSLLEILTLDVLLYDRKRADCQHCLNSCWIRVSEQMFHAHMRCTAAWWRGSRWFV